MRKISALVLSAVVFIQTILCVNFISYGASQNSDIEKTQLGTTDTYYSFDLSTRTLRISGFGNTPNFKNDNVSQPWYMWASDGSIEHVVIEEGITAIGDYFFIGVSAVDFSFPSTLVSIGRYAMSSANSVKRIVLPEGLKTIGNYAFYYSVALEEINIPSTVVSIGTSAFENCSALSALAFDDLYSDVSVGRRAFFNCRSLKSVTLPKRAIANTYSFGFYYDKKNYYVYDDFMLNVYRDSPGYTYASESIKDIDRYNIINQLTLREGRFIDCTYYDDSYMDEMIFVFTPDVTDYYAFSSVSESETVDVDCIFNDKIYTDNSLDDLNFTVDCFLEAGQTYYFTVKCVSQMSIGDFSVCLIQRHSYEEVVTQPTLSEDGYTTYTCPFCGDSFKTDFVKRLGILITGSVLLMEEPDGSHSHNLPIQNADISIDGDKVTATDTDGKFELYILPGAKALCISTPYGMDRVFDIVADENKNMMLGDISYFNFDFVRDGYVNAKDYAYIYSRFGEYASDNDEMKMLDGNHDGRIDDEDFKYAQNFFSYGKITESIYDN